MAYKKYRNVITEVDGIKFDSAAESRRYNELKLLERAGAIRDLELQPEYEIQPKYTAGNGRKIRAMSYRADFRYIDCETNEQVIEDVKRPQTSTAVYKLKRKLVEYVHYPLVIIEVDA